MAEPSASTPCPRWAELERRNAELGRRVAELEARVRRLADALAQARRQGKRQAAPFSRGTPKTDPGPPAAGRGRTTGPGPSAPSRRRRRSKRSGVRHARSTWPSGRCAGAVEQPRSTQRSNPHETETLTLAVRPICASSTEASCLWSPLVDSGCHLQVCPAMLDPNSNERGRPVSGAISSLGTALGCCVLRGALCIDQAPLVGRRRSRALLKKRWSVRL
jgi:hypothetical protein